MSLETVARLIFPAIVVGAGIAFAFFKGLERGRENERDRCMYLVHSALMRKNSGTARWIGNAIHSGAPKLMPPAEFFGDDESEEQ